MAVLPDGTVIRPTADRSPATLKFHHKHYGPVIAHVQEHGFATVASVVQLLGVTAEVAENELRAMTGRGWLHMWAERDRTATPSTFVEYRWEEAA